MKKLMIMAVMALALSLNANAQQDAPQMGQRMDRSEMIKMRTEAMAKEYGLDEAQQKKLLELNKQYPEAMPRMGMRGGGPRPGMGRPRGSQGDQQGENGQRRPRMRQGDGQPGQGFGQRGGGPRGPRGGFRMPDPETMEKYNAQLKEIMGDEKFTKYQADQEEARKRFMERMQQMQQQQNQ